MTGGGGTIAITDDHKPPTPPLHFFGNPTGQAPSSTQATVGFSHVRRTHKHVIRHRLTRHETTHNAKPTVKRARHTRAHDARRHVPRNSHGPTQARRTNISRRHATNTRAIVFTTTTTRQSFFTQTQLYTRDTHECATTRKHVTHDAYNSTQTRHTNISRAHAQRHAQNQRHYHYHTTIVHITHADTQTQAHKPARKAARASRHPRTLGRSWPHSRTKNTLRKATREHNLNKHIHAHAHENTTTQQLNPNQPKSTQANSTQHTRNMSTQITPVDNKSRREHRAPCRPSAHRADSLKPALRSVAKLENAKPKHETHAHTKTRDTT